jgi:hypothetical protein
MGVQVAEFKSHNEYSQWLQRTSNQIRVVNVSTTKRWSPWTGFLGDNKTYTITYEQVPARAAMAAAMFCCDCGTAIAADQRFCRGCGVPVNR